MTTAAFKWFWAVPERSKDVPEGSRGRKIKFSRVLEIFWGGAPRARHPDAGIVRPPKSRFFKTDQTPLELGKGKGNGLG